MTYIFSNTPQTNSPPISLTKRYRSIEVIKPKILNILPISSNFLQPKSPQNSPSNKSFENKRPNTPFIHSQNTGKFMIKSFSNRNFVSKYQFKNQESFLLQQRRSPQITKNNLKKLSINEKCLNTQLCQPLSFSNKNIKLKQKISQPKFQILSLRSPPKLTLSNKSNPKTDSNSSFISQGDKKNLLENLEGKNKNINTSIKANLTVSPQKQRAKVHSFVKLGTELKKVKIPAFIKEKQFSRSRKSSVEKDNKKNTSDKMVYSQQICKFFNEEMQTDYEIKINIKPALKKRSIKDFQVIKQVGEGAFAKAYMAVEKNTSFLCVLKVINKQKLEQPFLNNLIREIKIQSMLNHPHLTGLYGFFDDQTSIYLILELMPSGDLKSKVGNQCYSEAKTADIIRQVCKGIIHMHLSNIIHRDIKPENIFMYQKYVKIGDFGCATYCDDRRSSFVGSPLYLSPEQLQRQPYDHKVDIWQIGILAYELLFNNCPFQKDIIDIVQGTNKKKQLSQLLFPQKFNVSQQAIDFVQKCLDKNSNTRMNLFQALAHKFLKKTQKEVNLKI